jgi:hypothetical protein
MKSALVFLLLFCVFSCKRKWTQDDKAQFLGGCLRTATTNLGEQGAKTYCNCLLGKMMEKYPNANDIRYVKYDSSIVSVAKDCLKQH